MWAKVESNSVTKIYTRPTALTIGDVNYPPNIMSMWSASELEAIGIYEITIDSTNLTGVDYYQNTDVTYTYNSSPDTVTGDYGTATAKDLADLKTRHKNSTNSQANVLLQKYDWYTLRAADGGTAVPSAVTTYKAAVRTKANEHTTAIDAVANVDALAALTFDWPSEPE